MSSESEWAMSLSRGYAIAVVVLRSGEGVGAVYRTLCTKDEALKRGRDVYNALRAAAEAVMGGTGDEADELTDGLWDGLWEGPLELDRSGLSDEAPLEFRALGTLRLAPESTWTVLLDCLGDTYVVALEEHPNRAAAEASFGSWVGEIANT